MAKVPRVARQVGKGSAELPQVGAPAPELVWVIVGGKGAAGRVMVGETIYDGITPQAMRRETFERLKAQYDLREVTKP